MSRVLEFVASTHYPHPTRRDKYFVTYKFEGKPYNILVSKKRGPIHISAIRGYKVRVDDTRGTGEWVDAYQDVQRYLGPNHDFHGIEYTPRCFGYRAITFYFSDDTDRTFEIDDQIVF